MFSVSPLHSMPKPLPNEPKKAPLIPDRLKPGDTVAVLGLAGVVMDSKVVDEFKNTLTNLGLVSWLAPSVAYKYGYLSGTDDQRLEDLKQALLNPEVKAIMCIRGGWGSARLMEKIDWNWFIQNPKILVGFSDITYLLNAITHRTGLVTFHGPVGNSGWGPFTTEYFKKGVFNATLLEIELPKTPESKRLFSKPGIAQGALVGGNLCVFTSMLGSPYFPDCKNKILVLEEIGEEPYRIDRMLTSLRLAGVFQQISGLILGKFTDCTPESPQQSFTLEQVLKMHFEEVSFPVLYNPRIGHTQDHCTLPLGISLELNADLGTIRYLNPAVK